VRRKVRRTARRRKQIVGGMSVRAKRRHLIALIFVGVSRGTTMGLGLLFLWVEGITKEELRTLAARWGRSTEGVAPIELSAADAGRNEARP